MLDAEGHYVYEPLTHLLDMIEAHGGFIIRGGHVWVNGAACGRSEDWEEVKILVADQAYKTTGLRK